MIIVPTYLEKSAIHGLGVFSREFIPKGAKVWEYHPQFDLTFSEAEFERFPPSVQAELEVHLYQPEQGGLLYYESTMGKYMNHNRDPNVDFSDVGVGWATRDIHPDEELTCDYRHFMAETGHIGYL